MSFSIGGLSRFVALPLENLRSFEAPNKLAMNKEYSLTLFHSESDMSMKSQFSLIEILSYTFAKGFIRGLLLSPEDKHSKESAKYGANGKPVRRGRRLALRRGRVDKRAVASQAHLGAKKLHKRRRRAAVVIQP